MRYGGTCTQEATGSSQISGQPGLQSEFKLILNYRNCLQNKSLHQSFVLNFLRNPPNTYIFTSVSKYKLTRKIWNNFVVASKARTSLYGKLKGRSNREGGKAFSHQKVTGHMKSRITSEILFNLYKFN